VDETGRHGLTDRSTAHFYAGAASERLITGSVDSSRLESLVEDARVNALLAWLLAGAVFVVAVGNAAVGSYLWAGFAGAVLALVLVVPAGYGSPRAMLPWELLLLASLPLLGRTVATVPVTSDLATYLSVAAVALIVAVELQAFTTVEMTPRFAVGFVVATLAAAGAWAVVRFGLDATFGTQFLGVPPAPGIEVDPRERALMLEFVYSTVAGVLAGLIFEGYFRRRRPAGSVLPDEVRR